MFMDDMRKLAREAAHAAVIARFSQTPPDEKTAVDVFLSAYEYALEKLVEKEKSKPPRTNFFADQEAKGGKFR